jgi:alpha-glucosidase (family GH31 glycosyl hydrolase)
MVYGRENTSIRGYQWMIGDSLLATPLYGNDYETANSRDVYLPTGKWIEYDSGVVHQGPKLMRNYPLPIERTPLFVGGSGVVIENVDNQLCCRVYPLGQRADVIFWHPDGQRVSRLFVDEPAST